MTESNIPPMTMLSTANQMNMGYDRAKMIRRTGSADKDPAALRAGDHRIFGRTSHRFELSGWDLQVTPFAAVAQQSCRPDTAHLRPSLIADAHVRQGSSMPVER